MTSDAASAIDATSEAALATSSAALAASSAALAAADAAEAASAACACNGRKRRGHRLAGRRHDSGLFLELAQLIEVLDNSGTRVLLSCVARALARRSSAAEAAELTAPLLRVSLSGVGAAACLRSCTSASTLPLA